MEYLYALHATDAKNLDGIRSEGLRQSTAVGQWLGTAVYLCHLPDQFGFQAALDYAARFAREKPDYSGHLGVVIVRIPTSHVVDLQESTTYKWIRQYRKLFDKTTEPLFDEYKIPPRSGAIRPRSHISSDLWRDLIARQQPPMGVRASACVFPQAPDDDLPDHPPKEIAVHDPSIMEYVFLGTPEGARKWVVETAKNRRFSQIPQHVTNHETASRAANAGDLLRDMDERDLRAFIKPYAFRYEHGAEISRVRASLRAKNLNQHVVDADVQKIVEDFKRRDPTCRPPKNGRPAQPDLFWNDFSGLPGEPTAFVEGLLARLGVKKPSFSTLLERLPIQVRKLRDIGGHGYFIPEGVLRQNAVLIVKSTSGKLSRHAQEVRLHELAHYLHALCDIGSKDEEQWCDEVARILLQTLN